MGKYTIKKNKNLAFSLTKGVFSGEFNSINYVLYLAFLFLMKSLIYYSAVNYYLGWNNTWGFNSFEPLGLWYWLYVFFTVDVEQYLPFFPWYIFLIQIMALLPIVYRILNGNGHRNFFIFLALNLVLNILAIWVLITFYNIWNIEWPKAYLLSLSLLPLFIGFNPKKPSNINIKIPSMTKQSGNLFDDLD
jgi:hypothetical protein|tara:strand:+ start:168 stop:737 length:570 start_codon:yes stop_codon:yes gene_type:complete